jgi:GMP synthase-like glutamine amidotransferase
MKLLVFQHIDCEHPGIFRQFFDEARIEWHVVKLDSGEQIPPLEHFDALWVMGGPMDVWDTDACPWLVPEKEAIRRWVQTLKKPFLGLCLGHQLLADSLDGTCERADRPEIGILDVQLTEAARDDPLLGGVDMSPKCLQWHSVSVTTPPTGALLLASSPDCQWQAMRVGRNAWGLQFHVELQESTVEEWSEVPAYADALKKAKGGRALAEMQRDANALMPAFNRNARIIFDNFTEVMRRS